MTLKQKVKPFTGAIIVFIGAVFFSGKAVLVKIGYMDGVGTLTLLNLRMLFSLPFFIAMAIYSSKKSTEKITSKSWLSLIFLGVIGYYLASFFDFEGLKYISAGLERLIVFVYPTLVVLLSALVFKTKIHKTQVFALLLSYAGIITAFTAEGSSLESNTIKGSLLVFASAFTYALYLIGSGKLIPRIGAARFTAYAMIVSTFAVLIHSYFSGQFNLIATPKVYFLGFCMAVFCTVIPSVLLSHGIKLIGSEPASIIGSIGPVSTIALAAIFLNETITTEQIIGTGMVIAGVLFVSKNKEARLQKS